MKNSLITYYFPIELRYATSLAFIYGIYLIYNFHFIFAAPVILIGFCILTSKYFTFFDKEENNIQYYFSVLGMKFQKETIKYGVLRKLIITKENKGYTANSRSRSRQVNWSQYNGHLLYDDQKTYLILSDNDKNILIDQLKSVAQFLNIEIEDRTTPVPFRVNF